ncbi:MAG: SMP-30/gluconolactonase/LRE family protein [Dongiaceae bacterium]
MTAARLLLDAKADLGEGPLWSSRDQAIYWTDIKARKLNRFRLSDGAVESWAMPDMIGWAVERRGHPGFVIGLAHAIAELTLDPFAITPRCEVEIDKPANRLNDAKVDPAGRIWFGSMHNPEQGNSGAFYRLDPDFSVHEVDRGYVVANGPTFSPDGAIVYHTDSSRREIYRFDLRPDGGLSNKRVFVRFAEEEGYPDGMTTDREGCLWIAHWGGWRITRFRPDGTRDRVISMPVSQVTSCTFGGDKLDRLFVTSARIGLKAAQLVKEPQAGGLFEIDPGATGLPTPQFAG